LEPASQRETSADDALLDCYNALAEAVSGRLDAADGMLAVNDALRDTFERFDLVTTSVGVLVRPILSAAGAEPIMVDLERCPRPETWLCGTTIYGYPAERWGNATVVLGAEEDVDFAEGELLPTDLWPDLVEGVEPDRPAPAVDRSGIREHPGSTSERSRTGWRWLQASRRRRAGRGRARWRSGAGFGPSRPLGVGVRGEQTGPLGVGAKATRDDQEEARLLARGRCYAVEGERRVGPYRLCPGGRRAGRRIPTTSVVRHPACFHVGKELGGRARLDRHADERVATGAAAHTLAPGGVHALSASQARLAGQPHRWFAAHVDRHTLGRKAGPRKLTLLAWSSTRSCDRL
jgi:hypothetical protein